jgi:Domain of unknown function (DUF397)
MSQRRVMLGRLPFGASKKRTIPVRNAWVKSSFSGMGDCVEWRIEENRVRVRDSKDPGGPELVFTHSEWVAFRRGLEAGESAI